MRTPKLLGDPDAKKRRIAALDNDNSISLRDYIQWCGTSLPEGVTLPEFDPYDGGRTAKGLVVLSYPGPASESGFVSSENPDSTAANLSRYLDYAGIDRKDIVIWNLVPWFTPESQRTFTKMEMEKGSECLSKLINSLPQVKSVLLVGKLAQGYTELENALDTVKYFHSPHISQQSINITKSFEEIEKVFERFSDSIDDGRRTWTKEELKASLYCYIEMQQKSLRGEGFNKARYYETLSQKFGRSAKAFEYRMQNFSYVFSILGRVWVPGLKPAKNVGSNMLATIMELIEEIEGPLSSIPDLPISKVPRGNSKPKGNRKPKSTSVIVRQYERDQEIVAWVLEHSGGKCELCEKLAPFKRVDGSPYLEVHHVVRLADQGPDVIENAVALCPNCHRELHFSIESERLKALLYSKVRRLEVPSVSSIDC